MYDKIKWAITTYVPGTVCNLRCKYCYISNCVDETHLVKASYKYPLDVMINAFNPRRLGGLAEITVISGGETLVDDVVVPFIKGLLKYGHVVTVVTNLTLNNKIDELLNFPEEYLKRLIVKASLHWLELKRLNKIEDYFGNMKKILSKGASCYPFLVLSDCYMDSLSEIEQKCMEELGVMPHCSPSMLYDEKDDLKRDGRTKTSPECTKEFVDFVDKKFSSKVFDTCVKFLDVNVKDVFCYAGQWSFIVDLKNGGMLKCHNCRAEANFFESKKLPKLLPIGNNCQIANCALQFNFVSENIIPEVPGVDSYGKVLYKKGLINDEVARLLDFRFTDFYKQYSKKQKKKINKKVKYTLKYGNLNLITKVTLKLYRYLKNKLKKKGVI